MKRLILWIVCCLPFIHAVVKYGLNLFVFALCTTFLYMFVYTFFRMIYYALTTETHFVWFLNWTKR